MEYQLAVKTAEEAVASMKDAKLREIAFAQILAKLLGGEKATSPSSAASATQRKKSMAQPKAKPGRKQSGAMAWLRDLIAEGFFKNPRSMKAVLERLAEQSHHLTASDITRQMEMLCHEKVLRRKKLPPAEGKAGVWHWSNW